MKTENCSFISGFLLSVRRKELRRDKACSRLFGSNGLGDLNGKGATQFFCSSWWNSACMIFKKVSSSKDMAGLLSFLVLSNTLSPSSSSACTP